MPELVAEFKNQPQLEAVYVYKGIEGFKNYLRDIKHSVYGLNLIKISELTFCHFRYRMCHFKSV